MFLTEVGALFVLELEARNQSMVGPLRKGLCLSIPGIIVFLEMNLGMPAIIYSVSARAAQSHESPCNNCEYVSNLKQTVLKKVVCISKIYSTTFEVLIWTLVEAFLRNKCR